MPMCAIGSAVVAADFGKADLPAASCGGDWAIVFAGCETGAGATGGLGAAAGDALDGAESLVAMAISEGRVPK